MAKYKDYYGILGIPRSASSKEVKAAFRKLARQHHPDVNPGNQKAVERFKEINEAHEVLSDPNKRKLYDQLGPDWQSGTGGTGPAQGPQAGVHYRTIDPSHLRDLFGTDDPFSDFFHSAFGGQGGTARPRRGQDLKAEITITLEEAARGGAYTLKLTQPDGPSRRIEVDMPAGIEPGTTLRLSGKGAAGSKGGPAGDILVNVSIAPHPTFQRSGKDLSATVDVPLLTALLGGEVEVPTISGKRVKLTIPANTQNGTRLRLRRLGMPDRARAESGDLYAEVKVMLPVPMDERTTRWAKEMADTVKA